jgi:hypothetical protein
LLVMVALHIWSAIKLSAENRRLGGQLRECSGTRHSYAAQHVTSGLIVSFIIYHLHFTANPP